MTTDKRINLTMLCDFYELTMGNGYLASGMDGRITYFDLFFRSVPDGGGFAIAAGLEQVIDYIQDLHFGPDDIAYLRRRGIPWVEDSTNAADDYARNRVRHGAAPALASVNPAFVRAAGRTAALLRADEEYLTAQAEAFLRENAAGNAVDAAALAAAPWPVASRAVRLMAGRELGYGHTRAALAAAREGGAADVPGMRIVRSGGRLWFGADGAPALPERPVPAAGQVLLPEAGSVLRAEVFTDPARVVYNSYNIFFFQCENICGSISVAGRRPGDVIRPVGRGCTKQVRRLLAELGVPAWLRDSVPVLRDEAGVLAVYGGAVDERAAVRDRSGAVLKIEILPATAG